MCLCQVRFAKYEALCTNRGGKEKMFLRLVPTLLYACTEGPMLESPAIYRAIQDQALAGTSAKAGQPAVRLRSLPLQLKRPDLEALINGEVNASVVNAYMGLLQVLQLAPTANVGTGCLVPCRASTHQHCATLQPESCLAVALCAHTLYSFCMGAEVLTSSSSACVVLLREHSAPGLS